MHRCYITISLLTLFRYIGISQSLYKNMMTMTTSILAIVFFQSRYYYEMNVWITKEEITRKTFVFHSFWRKRPRWANII